ncbi:MAG: universal stress protein [Opitutae bacterium]|nr:universal stress protein [Opitutae bacterium]
MKTFLVPVDFSPVTDEVIDSAVGFARAFGGKVILVHVVQPPVVATAEYALPVEVIQEAMDANEKAAKTKLTAFSEMFRTANIACEVKVLIGPPVTLIREEAEKNKVDYILMGSHGHGKLYDFLVGSTASGIIKRAKCGVIIIPPADKHLI